MDRTKESKKAKTQESRERLTAEKSQGQEEDERDEDQETVNLLVELAASDAKGKLYCLCQRPYNAREYYIQCGVCGEWFHPKCLGKTKAECEAQRLEDGWRCGRVECKDGEQEARNEQEEGELQGCQEREDVDKEPGNTSVP